MNIRDIVNKDTKEKDLEVLLDRPFEISIDDFPTLDLMWYNQRQRKLGLVKKLDVPEKDKKFIVDSAIEYDYSPYQKVSLAYCIHKLEMADISKDFINLVRKMWQGLIFDGQGVNRYESLNENQRKLFFPEYADFKENEKKYFETLKKLRESPEITAKDLIKDRIRSLGKIHDKYLEQNVNFGFDEKTELKIRLSGIHCFRTGTSNIIYRLKD